MMTVMLDACVSDFENDQEAKTYFAQNLIDIANSLKRGSAPLYGSVSFARGMWMMNNNSRQSCGMDEEYPAAMYLNSRGQIERRPVRFAAPPHPINFFDEEPPESLPENEIHIDEGVSFDELLDQPLPEIEVVEDGTVGVDEAEEAPF